MSQALAGQIAYCVSRFCWPEPVHQSLVALVANVKTTAFGFPIGSGGFRIAIGDRMTCVVNRAADR